MKRVYILSDKEEVKMKIFSVIGKMSDKISVAGETDKIHQAIIDVIKIKPDFIINGLLNNNERAKFLDKYNVIKVCSEDNNDRMKICVNISEHEINKMLTYLEEKKKNVNDGDNIRMKKGIEIVVVGISTGGPYALKDLMPKIKKGTKVPIVIIQHMPPGFTRELARGLDRISDIDVIEADNKTILEPGKGYVMPGGKNMGIKRDGSKMTLVEYNEKYGFYTPSIDYMLETITVQKDINPLVAIMTGMGNDGFEGIRKLRRENKGIVLTQGKESCVVYGMPRVIDNADLSDIGGLSIEKIAEEINKRV